MAQASMNSRAMSRSRYRARPCRRRCAAHSSSVTGPAAVMLVSLVRSGKPAQRWQTGETGNPHLGGRDLDRDRGSFDRSRRPWETGGFALPDGSGGWVYEYQTLIGVAGALIAAILTVSMM